MKRLLLLAIITVLTLISCNKDDDFNYTSEDTLTTVEITLLGLDENNISDVVIYAYNESTWENNGDNPEFASFRTTPDDDGISVFNALTTNTAFDQNNGDTSETYRISVHYTIDDTEKIVVTSIYFDLGDDKTTTITLD